MTQDTLLPWDAKAFRKWMIDNDLRSVKQACRRIGTGYNALADALRMGRIGELTLRRLEDHIGRKFRLEETHAGPGGAAQSTSEPEAAT